MKKEGKAGIWLCEPAGKEENKTAEIVYVFFFFFWGRIQTDFISRRLCCFFYSVKIVVSACV